MKFVQETIRYTAKPWQRRSSLNSRWNRSFKGIPMEKSEMFRALLEILQEEIQIYRSMVDLLQEKQEGLIQAKINSIEEVEKKKVNVLLKIRLLEESRIGLIQKVRSTCGLSEEEMTLDRIIQVSDQRYKKDLGRCHADLKELITAVSNLSRMNQRLVG